MKYKDNDKKGDSFWDRMIDDLIWGAPLGGGVGINLKTGNIIPYPSFDEDNHHDWDNDEFSFDDLADFADDEDNDNGDRTLSFSLTFDSNKTAPDFSPRDGKTIEEQYYDSQRNVYCVGRAIRDNFKEISESFSVEEMLDLSQSMFVIFSSNQKLALDATAWAVKNFPKSLEGATCEGYRCGLPADWFLSSFTDTDHGEDRSFVYNYLDSHPELTQAVVGRQVFSSPGWPIDQYLPHLAEEGNAKKFIEIYKLYFSNPHLDPVDCSKFKVLDNLLFLNLRHRGGHFSHKIYSFLKSEIEAMPEKLKIDYLLGLLDYESYGEPLFDKPPILGKENYFVQIEQARKRIKEIDEEKDRLYDRINELEEECSAQEELLKEIERQYAGEDDI